MKFAEKLKQELLNKNKTQKDLADFLSLPPSSVNSWIIRDSVPAVDTALKIAEFFEVSVEELFSKEETVMDRITKELKTKKLKRADLCRAVGIDEASVRGWIARDSIPRADIALKIADYLNVSVEYLVTGQKPATEQPTELLEAWNRLPEDMQEILLKFIQSMAEKASQTHKD